MTVTISFLFRFNIPNIEFRFLYEHENRIDPQYYHISLFESLVQASATLRFPLMNETIWLNAIAEYTYRQNDVREVPQGSVSDDGKHTETPIYDANGNQLNNDSLLGINFELDGQKYYPRVDGTTRIKIADKVTDVLARIKINTENDEYKDFLELSNLKLFTGNENLKNGLNIIIYFYY